MYKFREFYIPERMMEGIQRYINDGALPGSFLSAVISNDFREACCRADDENMRNLPAYAAYFHNEAPSECFGSKEKMYAWREHKEKR